MAALKKIRLKKMIAQGGCCYYCGLPMWDSAHSGPSAAFQTASKPHRDLQCTAEHLLARCDGGTDRSDNIVAACHYCNSGRHKRKEPAPPDEYRAFVQKRMASGRW